MKINPFRLSLFASMLWALMVQTAIAAPTLESVYSWRQNPSGPSGALIEGGDGNYYGATYSGGVSDAGTIYKITPEGRLAIVADFSENVGLNPSGELTLARDGNFYGITGQGGDAGVGVVFRMTANGVLTRLASFGVDSGYSPVGGLVQGGDGNFYGATQREGAYGFGTIFKVTPAGTLTTLLSFTENGATNRGSYPVDGLVLGQDGNFYGMTAGGGVSGHGTVFKLTASGVLTTLVDFAGGSTAGSSPSGKLVCDKDGNFYGTTSYGGAQGNGTIFKMTAAGEITTLASFIDNYESFPYVPAPANPTGLLRGSDGNFYGTTGWGGPDGAGVVFKMTPAGNLTTLVNFNPDGGKNRGSAPIGLVQGRDGNLYGATSYWNGRFEGTVFKVTHAGVLTTLARFGTNNKGCNPVDGLTKGNDGNFYGTTPVGGSNGHGTVFRLTPDGDLATLINFTGKAGINKGARPSGGLVLARDGNFYGTTVNGGSSDAGTVFKISPSGIMTSLLDFDTVVNGGRYPNAGLVEGRDGNFYGTTFYSSENDFGTVFKMTPAGQLFTLVKFTGSGLKNKGSRPVARLVQGGDGNFYGTTSKGGVNNRGTVFKMTPNGELTTLVLFGPDHVGSQPKSELVQGSDGALYGTTSAGGKGYGTVFKVTRSGQFTNLVRFDSRAGGIEGEVPRAGLLLGADGNFYGTTSLGRPTGCGTVFKMTPDGVATTLANLAAFSDGSRAANLLMAGLVSGNDGNFYGTAERGGDGGGGVVYRLRFGPRPVTGAAESIFSRRATLRGLIAPNGKPTAVAFHYGTTPDLAGATVISAGTVPGTVSEQQMSLLVSGLQPGTKYYFRIVGKNIENALPQRGVIQSFTTLP